MTIHATDYQLLAEDQQPHQNDSNCKIDHEKPLDQPKEELEKVLFGKILLNRQISPTNFYVSFAYVTFLGFILISNSTLEPEFISKVLNVDDENLGKATANLYLWDYLIRLCFALMYGVMIDQMGRKFVLTIGLVLTSAGYFVIPLLSSSLFPAYYLAKSVYSSGIIALQMLPFAADYVHNSTKGIMTCLTFGIGFMGGAIAAGVIKLLIAFSFSYRAIYWTLAIAIVIVGFLLRIGIKGGNTYYKTEKSDSAIDVSDTSNRWEEVKKAFRVVPWITIALIFGILGNTDLYIMTTGLIIWIKGLISPDDDPTVVATNYQVIFFGLSFVITAMLAFKVDKIPHMKVIFPVLIFSTFGFCFVPFITNAYGALTYIFFVIEGLALPGILVYSTYLSARYNPPRIRGTISGISNGIGFIGAILILTIGGYLHDFWRNDAGFLIYLGLLVLTLIIVTILYFTKIKHEKKHGNYNELHNDQNHHNGTLDALHKA